MGGLRLPLTTPYATFAYFFFFAFRETARRVPCVVAVGESQLVHGKESQRKLKSIINELTLSVEAQQQQGQHNNSVVNWLSL